MSDPIASLKARIAALEGHNRSLESELLAEIKRNTELEIGRFKDAQALTDWRARAITGWLAFLLMSVVWVLHTGFGVI